MENHSQVNYIQTLVQPKAGRGVSDRRAWSIPLQGVWIPFFTATNTEGETHIPAEVLGAPLRLQVEEDGMPKFSKTGRPIVRLARELSDQIRIVRENLTFGLLAHADYVQKAMPDEYKAQVEAAQKAGAPIINRDANTLAEYEAKMKAEAQAKLLAEAEGVAEAAEKPKRKGKKAEVVAEAEGVATQATAEPEKELVAA